jgi:hypothetical protein
VEGEIIGLAAIPPPITDVVVVIASFLSLSFSFFVLPPLRPRVWRCAKSATVLCLCKYLFGQTVSSLLVLPWKEG